MPSTATTLPAVALLILGACAIPVQPASIELLAEATRDASEHIRGVTDVQIAE